MPELPEVETIRRDVEKAFVSQRIKRSTSPGRGRCAATATARSSSAGWRAASWSGVRPAGQVPAVAPRRRRRPGGPPGDERPAPAGQPQGAPLAKHTHVVLSFAAAPQLRFVDPRTFGELFVTTLDDLEDQVPELAHLGFDPLDEQIAWTRFGEHARRPQDQAEAAADGPAVRGRHRQHVRRRDPLRGRAAPRPQLRLA